MRCPFCGEDKDKVIDSRSSDQGRTVRRRRECIPCGRRFTTYERVEETVKLTVVKKDGTRVPYDRQKLMSGLGKSLYKRPIPAETVLQMVEQIEDDLFRTYEKEVGSAEIGLLVSEKLKQVDRVAYVRYASVYKDFQDIEDLLEHVKEVVESKHKTDPPNQGRLF
jgi:transcriptional repressor NrdR